MSKEFSHKRMHNWAYWIPELNRIQQFNLFDDEDMNNGRTGLINMGNTCFMASGLQCLSNTEDLTKYFLSEMYTNEQNDDNHFGSRGQISNSYYKLLSRIWKGKQHPIDIVQFRTMFSLKTGYYRDNSQQDSQEMVSILLDRLHEDLNRINNKPYYDMKERMPDESDAQASQRWWNCYKKRDDSIIVDLFSGQFKATIICPECAKVSITYDPFIFLSLSIPSEINTLKYKLFFIDSPICSEDKMPFFPDTKVVNLRTHISKQFCNKSFDCIEIVLLNKDKTIREILTDNLLLLPLIRNYEEIVCYEKKAKDSILIYTYPIQKKMETSYFLQQYVSISYLFYPWAYSLDLNCTLKDIWIETYQRIQSLIKLKPNEMLELSAIEEWKKPEISPFTLQFSHQFNKNQKCYFCEMINPLCNIFPRFNFETKYKSLIEQSSLARIIFLAEIPLNTPLKKLDLNIQMPLDNKSSPSLISSKSDYQLEDCLELFQSQEKLSSDNTWHCSECKKHQEALKKLEIFKAPNYLIVHLKRFKIRTNNAIMAFFNNNKNNAFINFPKEDFDLSKYVIGPNEENAKYDLYAVVNHYGGMNMGHYYAYCKNQGLWLCYNDEKLSFLKEEDVVTSNAYLLFYKRKVLKDL